MEDVSFIDVKIEISGPGDVNDVMHRKSARRILGDLKEISLVESCGPKKKSDFRLLAVALWRVPC